MNKLTLSLPIFTLLCVISMHASAGTPLTTIAYKSPYSTFGGKPYAEHYAIKIKINQAVIRYTNVCDNSECAVKDNYGFETLGTSRVCSAIISIISLGMLLNNRFPVRFA